MVSPSLWGDRLVALVLYVIPKYCLEKEKKLPQNNCLSNIYSWFSKKNINSHNLGNIATCVTTPTSVLNRSGCFQMIMSDACFHLISVDVDDLALIMNFQDFVSPASSVEVISDVGIVMPNEHHGLPPPLPSCSPPPLETPPNERATPGTERKPDHSSSPAHRPDLTSLDKAFRGITDNSRRQWRNDSMLSNYMLNPHRDLPINSIGKCQQQ